MKTIQTPAAKRLLLAVAILALSTSSARADSHWPSSYGGVMLQGFYWDSYTETQWTKLESQADELAAYFSLIWVPQSGNANMDYNNMGYMPYYYWDQNSSFGTESELRSMISTFKNKGLGTVADVVVNHHNTDGWFTFPAETYNGTTYQFLSTDICANDDGGAAATEAAIEGVQLSSNNDEGEDWSGCRDLDHQSSNVQTIVKAYVKYLKDDLGYTGFRYDMAKGFNGSHIGDYNDYAGIEFSVGEYWDGNAATVKNWIDATSKRSAAFDFAFRYTARDVVNNSNWSNLGNTSGISDSDYRQYAVTFLENHDTEKRSGDDQDPLYADTLALNAYLLSMPGTPCVFLKHWIAYKQEIKNMIDIRKAMGITNTSSYSKYASSANYYIVDVTGGNGTLRLAVGSPSTSSYNNYTQVASGYHYAYYMPNSSEMVWADKASGEYEGSFDVLLSLVSATSGTKIVYTLDGTDPSASNGTQLDTSTAITISSTCTLKAGLLNGTTVSNIITRDYTVLGEFVPYDITVYVNADDADSSWSAAYSTAASPSINFWTWNDDTGLHAPANTSWPGDKVTSTAVVDDVTYFYQTYTMTSRSDYVSFVFSVGTGSPQTVDVTGVNESKCFKISSSKQGSNYMVEDITSSTSLGIEAIASAPVTTSNTGIYTLDGRKVKAADVNALPKGVYVKDGKKIIVK
ncbi:MAG: chitobiase/beta-hexosaminidase C-terminal domain-containing protein [Prevotella sp.]|nr:chitobiase/beta-hexosaminidase C-terminal domain-containing protein [Prevotella sp.]